MAQDFHGVSLGGTTVQPVLINSSDQPVVAYVIRRDTTTGISMTFPIFPSDRIMLDETIKPGQESAIGGSGLGLTNDGEGDSLGYTLIGVLFADGTFVGQDVSSLLPNQHPRALAQNAQFAEQLQHEIAFYRDYAKSMQTTAHREDAIRQDASLPKTSTTPGVDLGQQRRRRAAARVLSGVLTVGGAAGLDQALIRLASLSDVKGA